MIIGETVKRLLKEEGRTQTWVAKEMNRIDPSIEMTNVKLSAITTGQRKMSGSEMLAFCKAVKCNPDEFMQEGV